MCARTFDNGFSAILISLFGTSNDDFCTFRLEKSLLILAYGLRWVGWRLKRLQTLLST